MRHYWTGVRGENEGKGNKVEKKVNKVSYRRKYGDNRMTGSEGCFT